MSITFKKLYEILISWKKILDIEKPTTSPASYVSYKYMQKAKKKEIIKKIVKLFTELNNPIIKFDNKQSCCTSDNKQSCSTSDLKQRFSTSDNKQSCSTSDNKQSCSTSDNKQSCSTSDNKQSCSTSDLKQRFSTSDKDKNIIILSKL